MPDFIGQETPTSPDLQQKTSLFDVLSKANTFDSDWQKDITLQDRQKAILSEISSTDTLAKKIAIEVQKEWEDAKAYASFKNKTVDLPSIDRLTRSILFELLAQKEIDLYISKESQLDSEYVEVDPKIELALTEFIKHPPIKELVKVRKSDYIGVVVVQKPNGEQERVWRSTYEMKTAKTLDSRAFHQIKEGSAYYCRNVASVINNLDSRMAEHYGLTGLGKNRGSLEVSPQISQNIIMCRDVDLTNPDTLINRSGHEPFDIGLSETEYNDFKNILLGKNPNINLKLHNSAFSEKELDKLRDQVLPLVKTILEKK